MGRVQDIEGLEFYTIMGYPLPENSDFFRYLPSKKYDTSTLTMQQEKNGTSRKKRTKRFVKYGEYIKKRQWLLSSIPFVESIYVCNSMSFNAVNKDSDIDLVCIVRPGYIRRGRFRSLLLLTIARIKRTNKNFRKKFCLSFYISSDNLSISDIRISDNDIYLSYRLAHLTPIYLRNPEIENKIFEENKRIQSYMPYFPMKRVVDIGITPVYGTSKFTRCIEYIGSSYLGIFLQSILKYIWLPILITKKKMLTTGSKNIIISDHMLKFYNDKRKLYTYLWSKYVSNGKKTQG